MTDDEQGTTDRPPGAADGVPEPTRNPIDAWLAEAPSAQDADLCPWCSAPLDPPTVEECPSCGAHLRGVDDGEIPGLTVVDPDLTARRAKAPKASSSAGVLAWLSGEADLVAGVGAGPEPTPAAGGTGVGGPDARDPDEALGPGWPGGLPGAADAVDPAVVLGPASPDAVSPPDPRVLREMRRIAVGDDPGADEAVLDAAVPDAADPLAAPPEADDPGPDPSDPAAPPPDPTGR